jgi:AraC-like DNA-binding protein
VRFSACEDRRVINATPPLTIPAVYWREWARWLATQARSFDALLAPEQRAALGSNDLILAPAALDALIVSGHHGLSAPGPRFGAWLNPLSHGALAIALTGSASPRAAIAVLLTTIKRRLPLYQLTWTTNPRGGSLRIDTAPGLVGSRTFFIESFAIAFASVLAGARGAPLDGLRYRCPAPVDGVSRAPICEVSYRAPWAVLDFDRTLLDAPFLTADAFAVEVSQRALAAPVGATLPDRLRALLSAGPARFAHAGVAARALNVSVRALHRQLHAHGIRYQSLLDGLRLEAAQAQLRDPKRSVADIADALNFADSRNFSRVFRRWTGQTPTAWRRAQVR